MIKKLFCSHSYKGGIRVETKNDFWGIPKKKYYSICKKCGKKKYV